MNKKNSIASERYKTLKNYFFKYKTEKFNDRVKMKKLLYFAFISPLFAVNRQGK